MKGAVIEVKKEHGLGRVRLEDGRMMSFDVAVCAPDVPDVGAEADVTLGPSRLGGERVVRLDVIVSWDRTAVPALVARLFEDRGERRAQVLCSFTGDRVEQVELPAHDVADAAAGSAGILQVQHKRGFSRASEMRFGPFAEQQLDPSTRARLVEGFKPILEGELEDWDDDDGCHCRWHRASLDSAIAAAQRLGADVKGMLPLKRWPGENDPDVRDRHGD